MSLAGGLAGCASTPPPMPPSSAGGGRFVDYDAFPSRHVAPRRVRVWLPPDADASRERCAVLYMQDGQNVFDPPGPMAHGAWDVDRHLLALRRSNAIRPTMVVAVWNTEGHRAREYGPQAPIESLPADLRAMVPPGDGTGDTAPLSDAYVRFLATELKPAIDARFPTRAGRDDTFLMGSSMGGLISLYALASFPDVFGAAACLSTHWVLTTNFAAFAAVFGAGAAGVDPRVERMAAAYLDWLRGHLPQAGTHRLYFDHGTRGLDALYGPLQQRVDRLLEAKGYRSGVDWTTRVFPGAAHDESAWRERLAIPLTFLLRR